MEKLGVIAGDSRDSLNRGKFFSGNAVNLFGSNTENAWEHQYLYYGVKKVKFCIRTFELNSEYFFIGI
jgi:hypothetical protein